MGHLMKMQNPIQNYAWGTRDTLALMRGATSPSEQPEAELWIGAHPKSSSLVETAQDGAFHSLAQMLEQDATSILPSGLPEFPFLLKILAIASPLSLQVHPTDEQAQEGFEREQAEGIPLDAAHRNYKDCHSKPETVIAISPVRILTGIRPAVELHEIAKAFNLSWRAELAGYDAAEILTAIFAKSDEAAATALQASVRSAIDYGLEHPFDEDNPGDPAGSREDRLAALADLILLLQDAYPGDRGTLVAIAMNQLFLKPGQSSFTPDGQVHAYISGTAVEIMNPSDNVMRAGLTPKHIDIKELLSVIRPDQGAAEIREPQEIAPGVSRYELWDPQLSLDRVQVTDDPIDLPLNQLAALLCTDGEVFVSDDTATFPLSGTESVLWSGEPGTVRITGSGTLYAARYSSRSGR